MTLGIVVGTRPEVIKLYPVIKTLEAEGHSIRLIHTGQHYDWEMSKRFFEEFHLRDPDVFLNTKPGTASNVPVIMQKLFRYLKGSRLGSLVILGDTNTALASSLACVGTIPVVHIEAGCRSFDRSMPEEINRVIISDCSDLNFAPTISCANNLKNENVHGEVVLSGHPIVEVVKQLGKRALTSRSSSQMPRGSFVFLTLHRPENVDSPRKLRMILESIGRLGIPVVFPVHPRTRKNLTMFNITEKLASNVRLLSPLGYVDTLANIRHASFVATDSGGIQQEAFLLQTPCLTIRRSFEWVETFEAGVNFLANPERAGFRETLESMLMICNNIRSRFANAPDVFGKGDASRIIVKTIEDRGLS